MPESYPMKISAKAFLASICLTAFGSAGAVATVDFTLTGPGTSFDESRSTTGSDFLDGIQAPITLAAGQSIDLFYDYTVTLSDDGLPGPSYSLDCAPLHIELCAPFASSGYEGALVDILVGYRDPRIANRFLSFSGAILNFSLPSNGIPEFFQTSGTIDLNIANLSSSTQSDYFGQYAFAFVDSNPLSPIPEPPSYVFLLAGLCVAGAYSHSRSGRVR